MNHQDKERASFEAQFPLPRGVFYSEHRKFYMASHDYLACIEYQGKWDGWQAAIAHDRQQRNLKERAQLDAEWVKLRELQEAYRQQRGEPFAALTLHKSGQIGLFADTVALRLKPITDEERRFYREQRGCELVEVFRAPIAPQPAEPVKYCTHPICRGTGTNCTGVCSERFAAPQPAAPVVKESLTVAEPVKVPGDQFRGDNAALVSNIRALLDLDAKGALVPHGVGGHARALLSAAAARLGQPAQPAASVRLLCRKCGEQTSISISSARLVTHFPNGMPRDARDIASDPEGKLIHEVDQDLAGYKKAQPISDAMMDLVDRLGSEYDKVDPRAWEYLLIYAPKHMLTQPAASAEPVGEVRHYQYSGVARTGFRQEAVLSDDAPVVPHGTKLYAAPTPPAAEQAQQDDDPCGAPIIGRLVCGAQHENQDPLHAEPDPALLISMATCLNHGFGLLDKKRQDEILHDMRKLWDEVVGRGYYSPAHRERYLTMLAKHQDAPTPEEEEAWAQLEKQQ